MKQQKTATQNLKSGQEVAKDEVSDLVQKSVAKTHRDYWKTRLERHCYTNQGKLVQVNEWSIRIQYLGRRQSFSLGTNNRDAAAIKARDIYLAIVAQGWDAAQAVFNPEMVVRKDDPSVGEFLSSVEAKSDLKAKTFRNYAGYFRRIAADICGIPGGKAKYAYRDGSRTKWIEKVDGVKLGRITSDHLNDWKVKYIKAAEGNPLARQSAVRSANSYLRCARSLFSKKWINRLGLRLPDPLPFSGVKIEKNRPPRYKSGIDSKQLFLDAQKELQGSDSASYLVFLLALGAGLRKSEIDGLEWEHINFEKGVIAVQSTEFRDVKTEESSAEVEIDPLLAKELLAHKPRKKRRFVITSKAPARRGLNRQYYRAAAVFKRLYAWLRQKGIKNDKPLHTLRKEFGSVINAHFGLYAAMTALRHSNIETTSDHYTDNKRRIALPLSQILGNPGEQSQTEPKAAQPAGR